MHGTSADPSQPRRAGTTICIMNMHELLIIRTCSTLIIKPRFAVTFHERWGTWGSSGTLGGEWMLHAHPEPCGFAEFTLSSGILGSRPFVHSAELRCVLTPYTLENLSSMHFMSVEITSMAAVQWVTWGLLTPVADNNVGWWRVASCLSSYVMFLLKLLVFAFSSGIWVLCAAVRR